MRYHNPIRERALMLYRKGMPCVEVCQEIDGPSPATVNRWVHAAGINRSRSEAARNSPKLIQHARALFIKMNKERAFSLSTGWTKSTKDLAYVIGVLLGDGTITRGGIQLQSIDREFINAFADACERQFGLKRHLYKYPGRRIRFPGGKEYDTRPTVMVSFHSSRLRDWLLTRWPYIDKWIRNLNRDQRIAWLRGIWDSEGSIDKNGTTVLWYNNSNLLTRLYTDTLLEYLEISARVRLHGNKRTVWFCHAQRITRFYNMVQPTIIRKRVRFQEAIKRLTG